MYSHQEFVLFERIFKSKSIRIYFHKEIYRQYSVVIQKIFKMFQCTVTGLERLQKGLYVCCNQDVQTPLEVEVHVYDLTNDSWIFELLTDVEIYIINELKVTVFHGAAVCKNKHIVLIMGERKSGKSTLTHFLIENGWDLIDDDCIYLDNGTIFGVGFPLRLRKRVYPSDRVFATCVDMDGEDRQLLSAHTYMHCADAKEITIIFPKYTRGSNFKKSIITKTQLFTILLQNVRFSVNEMASIRDVMYLMKIAYKGYSFMYSECVDVDLFLRGLLKIEEE